MASVFLSYVRENVDKARALAEALERAGHSVWWDRRIKGGAQYSAEIEAALNAADKVVVLWSAHSVASAWVRDEAAAGRDTGRLVPASLDSTEPPLGFRQFQTIDLSRWKGRSHPAQLRDLLEAVEYGAATEAPQTPPEPPGRRLGFALPPGAIVALAVIAVALIGGGWWWSNRAEAHTPIVAIESAGDSPHSREIARQLAVRIGELQAAQGNAFRLISGLGDADIRIQVDATDGSTVLRRDVSVLSGRDGGILWSASLQQPPARAEDLSEQLTLTSERVLSCALEALSDRDDRIDSQTLKLYLNGCSSLQDVYGNDQYNPGLESLFERVVAKAPRLTGAWAKLLQIEAEAAALPDPPATLLAKLDQHIAAVESLGIDIGELYAAKAARLPRADFLGKFALYDQGIAAHPDNPLLYSIRSSEREGVGRMNDSVADAAQAVQLDPLSPALAEQYASSLAYAGQIEAGFEQLRKAELKWPAAANLRTARFRLDLRYGDPREALALYRTGYGSASSDIAMESFILARIDPSPANIQRAVNAERMQFAQEPRYIAGLLQVLAQFGRKDEAVDAMLHYARPDATGYNAGTFFRPAMRDVWRDRRSIGAAAHMGLLGYWAKSGKWPDFCSDPTLPYDCRKEAAKYPV